MRNGSETKRSYVPRSEPMWPDAAPLTMPGVSRQAGVLTASAMDTGPLFVDLRRCLKMSLPDLARRLETRIEVLMALESGDVASLPPWPETVRVVSAYTMLARIDPRPVLGVLGERISVEKTLSNTAGRGGGATRQRRGGVKPNALAVGLVAVAGALRSMIPSPKRGAAVLSWAAVVSVLATILLLSVVPSKMQQASATGISGLFGGLHNYVVGQIVTVRHGMKWVEVDDPRSRKSDKLRAEKR